MRKRCRHCRRGKISRPRGLCWVCYNKAGVRQRYPSTSIHAYRGIHDFYGRFRLPAFPTAALPGTAEKIAILSQRAALGQELFHPDDALLDRRLVPKFAG
jgi:hypothetical protein